MSQKRRVTLNLSAREAAHVMGHLQETCDTSGQFSGDPGENKSIQTATRKLGNQLNKFATKTRGPSFRRAA